MESGVPLRPARPDSPSVLLFDGPDGPYVRKSYAHCPLWLRETVGRWAVNRECWALRRLSSSPHAPRLLGRPNGFTMDCEYVPGRPLEALTAGAVDPRRLAGQAESLLSDLKQAGVVHGDLGHDHWQEMGRETNLIWTEDGRLVAIDFAGALPLRSRLPGLASLARAFHQHDRLLSTKVAHHFPPPTPPRSVGVEWPLELWDLLRVAGKI